MKLLPEVSQKYVILKITTFETLLAMPHSQNSIGNSPFLNFQKYLIWLKCQIAYFPPAFTLNHEILIQHPRI